MDRGKPGGLRSIESQRVRQDWRNWACTLEICKRMQSVCLFVCLFFHSSFLHVNALKTKNVKSRLTVFINVIWLFIPFIIMILILWRAELCTRKKKVANNLITYPRNYMKPIDSSIASIKGQFTRQHSDSTPCLKSLSLLYPPILNYYLMTLWNPNQAPAECVILNQISKSHRYPKFSLTKYLWMW